MMTGPKPNAIVRVRSLLSFLGTLVTGLKSGGRWSVVESGGVAEIRSGPEYRFPGQVVPSGDGAEVEPFYAGGPFTFLPVSGRVVGSGWVCVRVEHLVQWEVIDGSLIRSDELVRVELDVIPRLRDAEPATVTIVTSPELVINGTFPSSIVYYPLAWLDGDVVSHVISSGPGTGVRTFNPAIQVIDET